MVLKEYTQAHIQAANKSRIKMFYVVDGDAEIVDDQLIRSGLRSCPAWRSRNHKQPWNTVRRRKPHPIPKRLTSSTPIMTTLLVKSHHVVNITRFDTDP